MNRKIIKGLLLGVAFTALVSINTKDTYAVNNEFDTSMEASYASTYKSAFYTMLPGSPLEYEPEDGVDTATGNLRLLRTDLELEGTGGMDFELSRYYNSKQANIGDLTVEAVDELKVDNVYVSFKNDSGETHNVIVSNTILKKRPQALKDMLGSYKKAEEGRKDTVKNTQRSKIKSNYENNVYGISTGWAFDFPWIETMTIKEGDESSWGEKPVYLHFGSKGIMPISTKENTSTHKYMITGIEGYNYEDIRLEDIDKKVDGVQCRYLLRDKTGLRTYFNKDGVIVLQKDAHNNTISYSYRNKIYFDKIVDSVGREINFHYKKPVNGMQFLEKVTVEGKKVKGGVSSKTIRYAISEKSYDTMRSGKIYGSILESATVDGTKEKYNYKTVETLMNAAGAGIASQRAVTNQAYLMQGVESEGAITHYEYRAGAFRAFKDSGAGQKRDVVTQVYYVTREYEQDAKTKKKANGIKYDYYQNQDGTLVSFGDLDNDSHEMYNYGTEDLSCVTLVSSFNPKKYKSNGLMSDYKYKKSDINVKTLQLRKKPKKNVTLWIYNENSLLANEIEDGKEKNETLYSYDKSGKGSLVVLETEKEYGTKRSSKPRTTKEGWRYDKYRNIVGKKDSKAYLNKNKGKEYLFTTEYAYYGANSGYPKEDIPYSLCMLIKEEEYLNKSTKSKLVANMAKNGVDYLDAEEQIQEGDGKYRTISKSDFNYNDKGNLTCEKVYPYYETEGTEESIRFDYSYNKLGQFTKENVDVSSKKKPAWNMTYIEEEKTFDSFGNELTYTDRSGLTISSEYNENTGEEIKSVDAVGTDYESTDNTITSEDKLKTMTIDNYDRCVVEIRDVFGSTVLEKDEKAGTWTERIYDYGSEKLEEDEEDDGSVDGLLLEEKVYSFEPNENNIIKDDNGEDVGNYDIGGRGNKILNGSRYVYDAYGEEIVSATFSGGAIDKEHCSDWVLSKQTEEVEEERTVNTSYEKQLNPKYYQEQVDKDNYYNQFDEYVLSETIEESIQDEEGNIISETSTYKRGNGIAKTVTKYTYDEFGKVTKEETSNSKYQDGNWLSAKETQKLYEYDYQGNVIKTETKQKSEEQDKWESQVTRSVYDEQGQLVESYSPKGIKEGYCTTYEYDLLGRMVKEKIPLNKKEGTIQYQICIMEYDINDKLVATEEEQTDSQNIRTEYSYDKRGNLLQVKNCLENGKAQYTQYVYDTEGNKIRQYTGMTAPLTLSLNEGAGNNSYEYVNHNYNITVSNKKKKDVYSETKYEYNKRNELTAVVDPEGRRESYSYDVYGNLIKTVDKNRNIINNSYDEQNRLIRTEVKSKETGKTTSHTYSYNEYGEISKQDDTAFEYGDVSGQVTKEVITDEKGKDISKIYTYDSGDNRTSFTVVVGEETELSLGYEYDAFSRLSIVKRTDKKKNENIAEYSYDEEGNLAGRKTFENGLDISYQYDLSNHLTKLENNIDGKIGSESAEESKISSFQSSYLKNGQKSSEKAVIYSKKEKKNLSKSSEYTYDRLGRLIKEEHTGNDSISYTYDAHNNRKEMQNGKKVTSYKYNKNDELLRTDELNTDTKRDYVTAYKNDPNGNTLAEVKRQETEPKSKVYFDLNVSVGNNRFNENVVNHYNALNELTETLTENIKVSYEYDAEGLRTKKKVNGETVTYVWDGDQLVMELDDKGNVLKRYICGTSLIYADDGKGTNRQYYVMNPHGDVIQLVDKSGKVTKNYDYDSFGNEINPDKDDDNPFRYSGEYYDKETETIYLRARYYQPNVGRFLTRDTYTGEESDSLSLNLYTYCNNDGVNNVDPSGHAVETALDVVSFGDSVYCMVTEPSLTNAAFLAWDAFSIIPGVPGSYVAKLSGKAAKAVKASKTVKKVKLTLTKKTLRKASPKVVAKIAKRLKNSKALKKIDLKSNFIKKTSKYGGKKPKKPKKRIFKRGGKTVDELIKGLKETTNGKGVARNFEAVGGYKQTLKDFKALKPTDVKEIKTKYGSGKVGTLSDGTKVVARPGSKTGGATLELRVSNSKVYKIRY